MSSFNKIFLTFLCFFSTSFADETNIKADVIKNAEVLDEHFNVDKRIILAYIKTESAFQPYVIAMKTNDVKFTKQVFEETGVTTKASGKYVSVHPKDIKEAEYVYEILVKNKGVLSILDYDFGIMQLNTRTVESYGANEKELYLDWQQNMYYGTDVLRGCFNMLKSRTTMANVIECYNRGPGIGHLNASDRSYLKKFMQSYDEISKEYN